MQTFIYGLLLAGVSGVTVVAFRHPGGYARLFPYMIGLATAAFGAITIWHIAVEMTWSSVDHYIVADSKPDATETIARLSVPYTWVLFWYLAVVVFFWVNLKLPPFLQNADAHDAPSEQENTE